MTLVIENPKAITSWSGFIYQGMIAVLIVLDKLDLDFETFKDYKIKIEKLDDFSIHKADDTCISIHQVKCKKADLTSGYTEAISSLRLKKTALGNVTATLHTSVAIRDYEEVDIELYNLNDQLYIPIDNLESEQVRILKKILSNKYNKKNLESAKVKLLSYELNFVVIQKILAAHSDNMVNNTALDIVDREIHFTEFIQIIANFNFEMRLETNHIVQIMKQRFSYTTRLFISEEEIAGGELNHLLELSEKITNLEDQKFINFLHILTPTNRSTSLVEVSDILDLFPTGYDDPFLIFVMKTHLLGSFVNDRSRYEVRHASKIYVPYGMAQSAMRNEHTFAERLYEGMFENKKNAEFYFTSDAIVSRDTNIKNLHKYINENTTRIKTYVGEGLNFNEPKQIEIISLQKAYEILGLLDA